ncbi:LysR family transcriptional regulator [Lichenifustis flavocetrariae]|uniref:LysR family transcriptional regulator n=1 Tax=Lichenifustis flavocetrariae TaxID=2949735 RepID=A0AA41YYS7_9HYPH|nr:LysR family transcriptional regulator [Lichenifustis flavocetrariae]MCW6509780.1 LysR family transcriptional regulator [Lichenifustis flavocetrariae]
MPDVGFPSFEQLQVLITVADTGSFSAAARRLNRAQSVISYAVAQLEEQLGLAVFDRSGRIPQLTEGGRALLADARRATASLDALRARASAFQQGIEAELRVGIDVMVPVGTVVHVLEAFASRFPTVGLRLCMEALGGIAELVMGENCDFGIGTELTAMPDTIRLQPIGSVRLVPVAAPNHALSRSQEPVGREAVRDATQIVLSDRSALTKGQDIAVLSLRTWRVGDLGAKHALLRAGLGWGNMPALMVAEDLASGRLVQLALREGRSYDYPLGLIRRGDRLLGPAAGWLADELVQALSRLSQEP